MNASEIMTKEVIAVRPKTPIAEVAKLLLEKHINGLPVVDEQDRVLGIICQSDLIAKQKKMPLPTIFTILDGIIPLRSMSQLEKEVKKMAASTVQEAMTKNPVCVHPDTALEEVAELMVTRNYHTIPVVQDGKLVGILGKEDILKTLLK